VELRILSSDELLEGKTSRTTECERKKKPQEIFGAQSDLKPQPLQTEATMTMCFPKCLTPAQLNDVQMRVVATRKPSSGECTLLRSRCMTVVAGLRCSPHPLNESFCTSCHPSVL
jgi:hypothetical protein